MNTATINKVNRVRRAMMRKATKFIGKSNNSVVSTIEADEVRRVLVSRPNGRLGNQLLLSPLIQELEWVFPNAKIDLFVKGGVAHVLYQNYPTIDQIIKLPSKPFSHLWQYMKVWGSLRKYRYDVVVNAIPHSSSGRLGTRLSRGRVKLYGESEDDFTGKFVKHMAMGPVSNFREHFAPLYEKRGEYNRISPLSLKLSAKELEEGAEALKELTHNEKPTIMLYTFATGAKLYPESWWAELYAKIESKYGEEYNLFEMLPKENVSQINFKAISYYSTDLRLMAAMIANAEVFISADCGIMHLASSTDTPTVGLFSVTNMEGYKPYNDGSVAIDTTKSSIDDIMFEVDYILKR